MNKKILILLLCGGLFLSFVLHVYRLRANDKFIEKITNSVFVNVEIVPKFADSIKIVANSFGSGDVILHGIPTNSELNAENKTIRFFGVETKNNAYPFIKSLTLKIPLENREDILKSIDNISIFMGNEFFYFSSSDLLNLPQNSLNEIKLPIKNTNNLIGIINWKGNDIFIVNSILAMLRNPFDFAFTYIFLLILLIILKKDIFTFLNRISLQNKITIILFAIIFFGFFIRFTGLQQVPFWDDELYSLIKASNPQLPFSATLVDPGNPPLYYVLLRFWLSVFGFNEFAARMFSVFLGTLAILAAYFGVKKFSDKKAAVFAALITAFCGFLTGQSQEIRSYILEILLVPICISTFLQFAQNPHSKKLMLFTAIPCAMLVNTHYYGAILVFVFGLYFITKIIVNKKFSIKNIKPFLFFNLIVALSFMPYFLVTSMNKAIIDEQFNVWIQKPGLVFSLLAIIFPLLAISYLSVKKFLSEILSKNEISLMNFIVFAIVIGYETIFAVSLFRSILTERYLIIGLPIFITAISILTSGLLRNKKTFACGILFGYISFVFFLNTEYPIKRTPYKASFSYIKQDMKNNSISVLEQIDIVNYNDFLQLANEKELPIFNKSKIYDIVYVPIKPLKRDYYDFFEEKGFSYENALIIRINENDVLYKKYE